MFKGKVLLFSLLLVFATSVYAGDVDDCYSEVYLATPECDTGMRLSICPNGDFEFIRDACALPMAYIGIIARNSSRVGIPGIPWSDYWMEACDPMWELCLCCDAFVADSLTNANGETTISGRVAGGGCVLTGGIYICIQGKPILDEEGDPDCQLGNLTCLDIVIVSPDLTADCWVNLSDLGTFGPSYNKCDPDPAFNPCCDFNDDTCCNLSDFAYMGSHYQHHCDTCP